MTKNAKPHRGPLLVPKNFRDVSDVFDVSDVSRVSSIWGNCRGHRVNFAGFEGKFENRSQSLGLKEAGKEGDERSARR